MSICTVASIAVVVAVVVDEDFQIYCSAGGGVEQRDKTEWSIRSFGDLASVQQNRSTTRSFGHGDDSVAIS